MGWDYSALQPSSSSDDLLKSLIPRIIWSSPYWSLIKNLHGSEVEPGVRWGREPHWGVRHSHSCAIHNVQQTCNQYADTLHNPSCVNHNVQSANMRAASAVHLCKAGRYRDTQDTSPLLCSTLQCLPTVACLLSTTPPVQFAICNQVQCSGTGGHVRGAAVWWQGNYNWIGAAWRGVPGA